MKRSARTVRGLLALTTSTALAALAVACSDDVAGADGDGSGGAQAGGAGDNSGGASMSGGAPGGSAGGSGAGGSGGGSAAGGSSTGGSGGGSGAGGSSTGGGTSRSTCWTGPTTSWTATDYISRKWARWPIPNPGSSGQPNPMSYTETAEGIRDDVTGLVWQTSTSPSGSTWQEALAYCSDLGPGWTLPTRIELTTIIRHDQEGAKVDPLFEFGASAGWTWTSTPWVVNERSSLTGDSALSWFINFAVGDSHNSLSQTNTSGRARCVRIQETMTLPADHYTVRDEEVRDNYTCLTWQRAGSGTTPSLTREQAVTYCEDLTLGGHDDWRLPELNELASLVDDVPSGDVSPAIDDEAFPQTSPDAKYWSASGHGSPADSYWTLNFEDGYTEHDNDGTTSLGIARCVR